MLNYNEPGQQQFNKMSSSAQEPRRSNKRRASEFIPGTSGERLFMSRMTGADAELNEEDGDSESPKRRKKSYDQAARAKFKRKMQKQILKQKLSRSGTIMPDIRDTQSGNEPFVSGCL